MKKFPISQLESARRNPSKFGSDLKKGISDSHFRGRPKSVRWLDAVGAYHKTSSKSEAIRSLKKSFSNRKATRKNLLELEHLIWALENYIIEHHELGYIYLEKAHSLQIILSGKVKITGWIWLLNMIVDGRRAGYVITNEFEGIDWQTELRFPIIQDYIAHQIYGCQLNEVEVGVIDYTTGQHHKKTFTEQEVNDAIKELTLLGQTISKIL